jgi:hypothetical protein
MGRPTTGGAASVILTLTVLHWGADAAPSALALPRQTNPNKSKPSQIKPSKSAWFNLVLFVRIGTFQWVTANQIRKTFLLSHCA